MNPRVFFRVLFTGPVVALPLFAGMAVWLTGCCDNKRAPGHGKGSASSGVKPAGPEPRPVIIRPEFPMPLFTTSPLAWENRAPRGFLRSHKIPGEVAVPAGVRLLSLNCPVTSSDPDCPLTPAEFDFNRDGDLSLVTDGRREGDNGYYVSLREGRQWVQIDLRESKEIHLIWVWHFHKMECYYKDVIICVSNDPEFQTGITVFNNDVDGSGGFGKGTDRIWEESSQGCPVPVAGVKGRYVRLYSSGRDIDDTNQYIEVEVYGR